jgi:hypothetical protein
MATELASAKTKDMMIKANRTQSLIDYKLVSNFERLRSELQTERYANHLRQQLGFWALPNDRRLPLTFLGRTLGELLDSSFEELYATPGIGQKKIASLIELLARAVAEDPERLAKQIAGVRLPANAKGIPRIGEPGFDVASVSESQWVGWRNAVARHGLENEPLGRYAQTLQDLPRVLWHTPLKSYLKLSLGEIRDLKTHGEKRVRVVVETFGALSSILSEEKPVEHLAVRIVPRFVQNLETWVKKALRHSEAPSVEDLRRHFVNPLLDQILIDAGDQIHWLAECRLGLRGRHSAVRLVAKEMGLTRARVYQLLNDISDMIAVRWPEGAALVSELEQKVQGGRSGRDLELFHSSVELFFPARRPAEPANGAASSKLATQKMPEHARRHAG